jgi:HSP20 family protein
MERMRRDLDRLTSDWPREGWWGVARGYPALNVWTSENSAVVTAELAGVHPGEIDISVEDDTLTLRGERRPQELEEGASYHRRERRFGSFVRTLRLPFRVEAEAVEANFQNGVLRIELPRAEADKPRKITVKAS